MNIDAFVRQVRDLRGHAEILSQRAGGAPTSEVLPDVVDDLFAALEELQVAEEELRQHDEALAYAHQTISTELHRYQELFNLAPDGYLVTDMAGRIRDVNCAAAEQLGARQDYLAGRPLAVYIALDDRRGFRTILNQLPRVGRAQEFETRLQPRGGVPVEVAITASAVRDRSGRPIALQWLLRDIGDRKRIEHELREAAERYRGVIDNAFEAIFQVTVDGRLLTANEAAAGMLGYESPQQLLHSVQNVRQLYFEPDARELVRLVKAHGGAVTGFVFDAHLRHRQGGQIPVSMNVRPFLDADDRIVGVDVMVLGAPRPAETGDVTPLIAIANPDSALLELLQSLLEDEGFTTISVPCSEIEENGVAALSERYGARALIYDVAPPNADGRKVLQRVAQEAAAAGLGLVVTTTDTGRLRRSAKSPPFEVVRRPFDVDNLMRVVRKVLLAGERGNAGDGSDSAITPAVAIFNPNEPLAAMLCSALAARGMQPVISWNTDQVRATLHESHAANLTRHPRVIVYDIAPPYLENWALFQVIRRNEAPHGCRFVLTTPNKRALSAIVGANDAIEIANLPADLAEVVRTAREKLAGA